MNLNESEEFVRQCSIVWQRARQFVAARTAARTAVCRAAYSAAVRAARCTWQYEWQCVAVRSVQQCVAVRAAVCSIASGSVRVAVRQCPRGSAAACDSATMHSST